MHANSSFSKSKLDPNRNAPDLVGAESKTEPVQRIDRDCTRNVVGQDGGCNRVMTVFGPELQEVTRHADCRSGCPLFVEAIVIDCTKISAHARNAQPRKRSVAGSDVDCGEVVVDSRWQLETGMQA
tara:strand:- start:107 stop:484 length:378 start_codon:yes stop_codon:yes gene_type:complete